jgi:hypothetical protein
MSTKSSYARAELAVGRRRFEIFRLDALQSGISLGAFCWSEDHRAAEDGTGRTPGGAELVVR